MLRRGFGRHARCLLSALLEVDDHNKYTFVVDSPDAVPSLPATASVRLVKSSTPTIVAASAGGRRGLRDMFAVSRALSTRDLDVLLFPTLYSYVPTFGRKRRFVIVHDVIAETFPTLAMGSLRNRLLWAAKGALGRQQADVLLTVSEYSRQEISRHFRVPPEKLHVVGEASDPIFRVLEHPVPSQKLRELRFDPARRTVVYVGGFSPHKNVEALVRSIGRLKRSPDLEDVRLFLVGDYEQEAFLSCFERLGVLIASLGLESRVIFTGYLPDEELVTLLNLSTVLVLPSFTEGFGLPAVEAAACGCPVIATTESPLRGLLGNAARYVDPRDEPSIERTLEEVLRSEAVRRQMREDGLIASSALTWQAAARRLVRLLDDAPA
jgi:glycosyltransferase involved in cell wall biosynthesis